MANLPQEFYRLNTLPKWAQDFLVNSSRGDNSYLRRVEETGKLPSGESLESLNFAEGKVKLPSRNEAIKSFIKTIPTNESSTIEQLQAKKQAYQDLGGEKVTEVGQIDRGALTKHIANFLINDANREAPGADAEGLRVAAEYAASNLASGATFDVPTFAQLIWDRTPGGERGAGIGAFQRLGQNVLDTYTPALAKGDFSTRVTKDIAPNVQEDITKIQSILQPKIAKAEAEGKIGAYMAGLPGEREREISEFEESLGESRGQFFEQELTPRIIRSLQARGALHSGDLASTLAEAGTGLQREVRDITAPLRVSAAQEISGKRYENLLRQSLEATGDIQSALAFARQASEADKQRQFGAAQSEITRRNQEQLMQQQLAVQLALGRQPPQQQPSAWQNFLAYGLPSLTTIGVAGLQGYQQGRQNRQHQDFLKEYYKK